MSISPARLAAFRSLLAIETEGAFSSDALAAVEPELGEKDRSLCHELVLGSLRRQIYFDRLIDKLARGKKLDPVVRISLRLGIYQLLFLNKVPDYSAINESVELVRRAKKVSATGFVNAILRRLTRERVEPDHTDETDQVVLMTSHPRWLIERWTKEFGLDSTRQIAVANNEIPPIAFRATNKTGAIELDHFGKKSEVVAGCYLPNGISTELRELEAYGNIYFQDEASQMVASTVRVSSGGRLLDICASPGSKTGHIAYNSTGMIVAGDVRTNRVSLLCDNLSRQGVDSVFVCQHDATRGLPFADSSFDIVLIDAPCSGTGTIRHNPEIRYRLGPEDFKRHADKQLTILKNASKLVKIGGRIVYSTCSIERVENEDVIQGFIAESSSFELLPPNVNRQFITDEGFARTFPHRDNMDGFFIADIKRLD